MPQVTVYIRKDDMAAWSSVEKKAEFIHGALHGALQVKKTQTPTEVVTAGVVTPRLDTFYKLKESIGIAADAVKLCKIHGIPLDDRGRCMQKGCRYA